MASNKVVEVINTDNSKVIRRALVNFDDQKGKKFLAKTLWWALHNNLSVEIRDMLKGERVIELDNRD